MKRTRWQKRHGYTAEEVGPEVVAVSEALMRACGLTPGEDTLHVERVSTEVVLGPTQFVKLPEWQLRAMYPDPRRRRR